MNECGRYVHRFPDPTLDGEMYEEKESSLDQDVLTLWCYCGLLARIIVVTPHGWEDPDPSTVLWHFADGRRLRSDAR